MEKLYNVHTHYKPKFEDEYVIRNAYLTMGNEGLNQLSYQVSVGLHPWFIDLFSLDECMSKLTDIVMHPKVLAIGEIGLDKTIEISMHKQLTYFDAQLTVAKATQKPVIIHAVKSYNEFIPFLKKSNTPFIFHQFHGNLQQAKELLKYHVKLSFGKNLFDFKTEEVIKQIPDDSFFLETDNAAHLHIYDIYRKASELKKISIDELKTIQLNTFAQIFKTS